MKIALGVFLVLFPFFVIIAISAMMAGFNGLIFALGAMVIVAIVSILVTVGTRIIMGEI